MGNNLQCKKVCKQCNLSWNIDTLTEYLWNTNREKYCRIVCGTVVKENRRQSLRSVCAGGHGNSRELQTRSEKRKEKKSGSRRPNTNKEDSP